MAATRRRLLLGATVAPLAALPLPAAASPDAALIELGRQHALAKAGYDRLADRADALAREAEAITPAKPAALRVRPQDWLTVHCDAKPGAFMGPATAQAWRDLSPSSHLIPAARERLLARAREVIDAEAAHVEAVKAAQERVGYSQASELCAAAGRVLYGLEDRIFASRAVTPEGWRIKARIAAELLGPEPDGTYEDHVTRSLLADLTAGVA